MAGEKIGFVGLGLMGHGMAKNLVEKGWPLAVLAHRNRGPIEDLISRGAQEARTARELALRSEIVVLCVTGSPHRSNPSSPAVMALPRRVSRFSSLIARPP